MMLSIDIIPVPTDEAVKEAESRLLGVETNITQWQRRQNANNNFSAVVPYDMEQQRSEMKDFLDDLTTRDQRMMYAVLTLVHTADTKEQLDAYRILMDAGEILILRVTAHHDTHQTVVEYLSCAPIDWTREALKRSQPIKQLTMQLTMPPVTAPKNEAQTYHSLQNSARNIVMLKSATVATCAENCALQKVHISCFIFPIYILIGIRQLPNRLLPADRRPSPRRHRACGLMPECPEA